MANQSPTCPLCAKPVPQELLGLCPACLLKAGMGTMASGEVGHAGIGKGFVPPRLYNGR